MLILSNFKLFSDTLVSYVEEDLDTGTFLEFFFLLLLFAKLR